METFCKFFGYDGAFYWRGDDELGVNGDSTDEGYKPERTPGNDNK